MRRCFIIIILCGIYLANLDALLHHHNFSALKALHSAIHPYDENTTYNLENKYHGSRFTIKVSRGNIENEGGGSKNGGKGKDGGGGGGGGASPVVTGEDSAPTDTTGDEEAAEAADEAGEEEAEE